MEDLFGALSRYGMALLAVAGLASLLGGWVGTWHGTVGRRGA